LAGGGIAAGVAFGALGAGLGYLADSVVKFANIDGDALVKTGEGMRALGSGLLSLTGKELLSGLGGLASGILGLFQEDPVSKLKRFGEVGEPLRVTAEALRLFADNMPRVISAIESLNKVDFSGMDKLTTAIDNLQQAQSGGILGAIGNFLTGTPQVNATTTTNQTITTTGIDTATADYYEKTTRQFNRMIELLELAHSDASDMKKTQEDGFSDVKRAVESRGRVY